MNEFELTLTRRGEHLGYQRIMAGPGIGDFGSFQPGAGTSMGYDDLKIVEAKKFVSAILGKQQINSNINDAVSAAAVCDAVEQSAESGQWVKLPEVAGVTSAKR